MLCCIITALSRRLWFVEDWRTMRGGKRGAKGAGPLNEPALFQRPISPNTAVDPIDASDVGASPLGDRHIRKASPVSDEEFIFGHLASTLRPTNGRSQQATGSRAGTLMVIPTDGSVGSEIMAIASAISCEGGSCARDHMAWMLPSRQPRAITLIAPIIDTTMASRLTAHGAVHGSSGRSLDPSGRLDPQLAIRIDGQKAGPVKTSPKSPWRWKIVLGALADGVAISKTAVSRAARSWESDMVNRACELSLWAQTMVRQPVSGSSCCHCAGCDEAVHSRRAGRN